MLLEILDEGQGIFSVSGLKDAGYIQLEMMKRELPENAGINDLAFFYMHERDWILINKDHVLYEWYFHVISAYLGLSAEGRRKSMILVPNDTVKRALKILDGIIIRRALIYGEGGLAAYGK